MELWERVKREVSRQYFQARRVLLRLRVGNQWQNQGDFMARRYPDYDTYLDHQKTKFGALRAKSIERHDRRFHAALSERLGTLGVQLQGASVLCLGARQGSEVRAFIDRGAFAVGIDLNPGPKNPYVLIGDFHRLQFADASVDYVYTNSLDHAFDIDRILSEVRRVLTRNGGLIVEAGRNGPDAMGPSGDYEVFSWRDIDALVERISAGGFTLESRRRIDVPWAGEQLVLRPVD